GRGAVGDSTSLGVAGKTNGSYTTPSQSGVDYAVDVPPRWINGAIPQCADVAELWADFICMLPPSTYFAADMQNASLLETRTSDPGSTAPSFFSRPAHPTHPSPLHLPRPPMAVAPHRRAPKSRAGPIEHGQRLGRRGHGARARHRPQGARRAQQYLARVWNYRIGDGTRNAPMDSGLLRNYLNDMATGHGFGEISGSALLAAVAYRIVVLAPDAFPAATYVSWADSIRLELGANDVQGNPHVTQNGTATPAVNPLAWLDTAPWTAGDAEGNNSVVLLYLAWRDCVWARLCQQ
ncbi:hypothetical protein C8R44DRAFT_947056, partial [Mycena epipterygia]